MKPSNGKAKDSYDAMMRLVEGEKEVAWAEHQNAIILPHNIAPHLANNAENNISPAFLQSSGILTCHATPGTTQLHNMTSTTGGSIDFNGFDDENSESIVVDMLNSPDPKQTVAENSEIVPPGISDFHDTKDAIPNWAERTPVAMTIDQERGMTTPLATCTATVTKLPKSPHPRSLQVSATPSSRAHQFNLPIKFPFVPSSIVKEKHCVGMATNNHNNMAATTPKCGHVPHISNHGVLTPGTKQPFANLPPIFAPTLMKVQSNSPDEVLPPEKCQSEATEMNCNVATSVMGFEDNFVPFNTHDLSPNQEKPHNTTYCVDKESSASLNRTYTQALSELEEDVVNSEDSKVAARKMGQEIWQKVKNIEYPPNQHAMSHPLRTVQCDGERPKKIPGYLTMTTSAAIKRLPSTRQPRLRSNKENIPGGRKRANTVRHSNRTVQPLARSASLKSRPLTHNW